MTRDLQRWYRVSAIARPPTYVFTTPARAASEYPHAHLDAIKVPPRDWLEREAGRCKDLLLKTRQHLTLIEDTLAAHSGLDKGSDI
jgi:hypothetical protein